MPNPAMGVRLTGSMLQMYFAAGDYFGSSGWVDACDLASVGADGMAALAIEIAALQSQALVDETAIAGKSPIGHAHIIADTTGLQAALDAATNIGAPASRTLVLGTGVQASNNAKPAIMTVNLTSTASFSLAGGTTNSAEVVLGTSKANAEAGIGFKQLYSNSVTGTIAVGLNMNSVYANGYVVAVPAGYWVCVRQTAGAVTITSAFDQAFA